MKLYGHKRKFNDLFVLLHINSSSPRMAVLSHTRIERKNEGTAITIQPTIVVCLCQDDELLGRPSAAAIGLVLLLDDSCIDIDVDGDDVGDFTRILSMLLSILPRSCSSLLLPPPILPFQTLQAEQILDWHFIN